MAQRVCPWWIGYLLASPMRRWLEIRKPEAFLSPWVKPGMTVFEPGPGMGFFTLPMARLVGTSGRVIAADIQPKMLDVLRRRAQKAGVLAQIETRLVARNSMGVDDLAGKVDFVLAWAIVHEFPSTDKFFREAAATLKAGGHFLLGEPSGHVNEAHFAQEIGSARVAGLVEVQRLTVSRSSVVLLARQP
jgi:ubiquinone/menaquinone biosynthesis C-methylase UbiE